MRTLFRACFFSLAVLMGACNSGTSLKDALDLADGVPRKDIDRSRIGVNAFFNDARFGSMASQYEEIRDTLGIRYVRLLFAWNEGVQPSPSAEPNFSFYDDILANMPGGMDALVVLTDVPSWMHSPDTWIGGNPRRTFVEGWVQKVAARYRGNPKIIGWEVWNEPNQPGRDDNTLLQLTESPENFVELVAMASNVLHDTTPGKFVVSGATTAINQNFPGTLNYNERLRDGGIVSMIDIYGIHYYGRQFENVVRGNGVADFLKSVGKRVWVTESGAQGTSNQLEYAEQAWPFIIDKAPNIDRIYQYQMYEPTPPESTYALRNLSSTPLSDLYVWLRDGQAK